MGRCASVPVCRDESGDFEIKLIFHTKYYMMEKNAFDLAGLFLCAACRKLDNKQ